MTAWRRVEWWLCGCVTEGRDRCAWDCTDGHEDNHEPRSCWEFTQKVTEAAS